MTYVVFYKFFDSRTGSAIRRWDIAFGETAEEAELWFTQEHLKLPDEMSGDFYVEAIISSELVRP